MAIDSRATGTVPAALPRPPRRNSLQVVEFEPSHIAEAARLHVASCRHALESNPVLPVELLETAPVESLLRRAVAAGLGVAAIRNGDLEGYMAGFAVPELRGSGVSIFVPEWAHGSHEDRRGETYEAMYPTISAEWAEAGRLHHGISVMAGDHELERAVAWLGFGLCVVDAVRDLPPILDLIPSDVAVSRATLADLDALGPLAVAHEAHYALGPTFLVREEGEDPHAEMERSIRAPGGSVWIARSGSEIVSFIQVRPPAADVCRALRSAGTIGIGGAFTRPEARGTGAASALLARIVEWAGAAGFDRLAVDFESANLLARRFWLRYFSPVCLTFERHLDDRLALRRKEAAR